MSAIQPVQELSVEKLKVSEKVAPAWRLVCQRDLVDLWIGGKAFILIFIYSVLLGVMVYVYSFNTELSLIPPKEAVYEMLKNAMAVAMFVGLVIGADSLSGERDRATLEALLLTPTNRRHIIIGKFLAAFSVWPVAYVLVIPYLYVLAQGDMVFVPALFWGAITGTVLVIGYIAVAMLVSFSSSTNRISYFTSLGIYAFLLIPAELPGKTAEAAAQFLQWINPVVAVNHFLVKHLVNYRSLAELWTWLISSFGLAIVSMLMLLFVSSGLRLEAGRRSKVWSMIRKAFGVSVIGGLTVALLLATPAFASQEEQPLTIAIDTESKHVKTGDSIKFNTNVTNTAAQASPPLIVAMNVINLDESGDIVDPEDWSPQRAQYIDTLGPGESAKQSWIINPILAGNFMVYMVLIPEPENGRATGLPVTSSGIHLTVEPFSRLNPARVLPFAFGGPLMVLLITYFVYRRRRQQIDLGGSSQIAGSILSL